MSGLLAPLSAILTKVAAIQVVNNDGKTVGMYCRVWNNQIDLEQGDKENTLGYDFPKPASFIEIVSPVQYKALGLGYREADVGVKIHICHEYLNADGTLEQDLVIFGLRDQVIEALSLFCPAGCTAMVCVSEYQDYKHRNIYHYICEFITNNIDDTASIEKQQQQSTPPYDLVTTVVVDETKQTVGNNNYNIPQK